MIHLPNTIENLSNMPYSRTIRNKWFKVVKREAIGIVQNHVKSGVAIETFAVEKTFDHYMFLELYSQGGWGVLKVDWSLIADKNYGKIRCDGINRNQVPIPKILLDPFKKFTLTLTLNYSGSTSGQAVGISADLLVTHLEEIEPDSITEDMEVYYIE